MLIQIPLFSHGFEISHTMLDTLQVNPIRVVSEQVGGINQVSDGSTIERRQRPIGRTRKYKNNRTCSLFRYRYSC